MTGPGRRFDPAELRDREAGDDAQAGDVLAAARELEALATRDVVVPTVGFDDRVMAAIAGEAPPKLVLAAGRGVPARLAALVVAVGAAWRVATSSGRPAMVRAQALAFVLLVVFAGGSLASVAAIGAANLLDQRAGPTRNVGPLDTETPSPTTSPEPANGDTTRRPAISPVATSPADPNETPGATKGELSSEPDPAKPSNEPDKTPRPTRTPHATETPEPGETDGPGESPDDGGGGGDGGSGGNSGPGGGGG